MLYETYLVKHLQYLAKSGIPSDPTVISSSFGLGSDGSNVFKVLRKQLAAGKDRLSIKYIPNSENLLARYASVKKSWVNKSKGQK